jgi:hypothetical protein
MPSPAWRTLYETAERFRQIAPWSWMHDAYVFGVRDPATGVVGWCTVIGNEGEVLGLVIYRGDQGFDQLMQSLTDEEYALDAATYGEDAIVVLFCDRREVDKKQLSRIRALGLQPRGSNAWPVFDDLRPGRSPVALTEAEVPFCLAALEQSLVVAERIRADPKALDREDELVLVRELDATGTGWTDTWIDEPPPLDEFDDEPEPVLDEVAVQRVMREATRIAASFECDVFPMKARIDDGESDPFTPAVIMVADAGSGLILHVNLVHPDEREVMTRHELMVAFQRMSGVPARVAVARDEVERALAPLADVLQFELVHVESLPAIQEARAAFAKNAASGVGRGPGPKRKTKRR